MRTRELLSAAMILCGAGGYAWLARTPLLASSNDRARVEGSESFATCDEARAAGKAPLLAGQPGYRGSMDEDGDGVACESPGD